ncbi:hypothetical protein [uncultured Pseudodesulfovibrio sp.]|uniref:hypothetical protein n=1 Tax=uncultured Pseudodesulfovibrio sp. TaxID=2035858 RepID=UPI0029C80911|nr:hypothetical protein [uncultured Pseudodesulfovibrio sp.]
MNFIVMKAEIGGEAALIIFRSRNKKTSIDRKNMPQDNVFEGMSSRVDKQGNVLYTLASGGMIKDMGKDLFFSKHDEAAQEAAEQLAWRKFGRDFVIEGNRVGRKPKATHLNKVVS